MDKVPKLDDLREGLSGKEDGVPWIWPRAAYVHIPFCAHHCGYCDFAVAVGQDQKTDAYLNALETELSCLLRPFPVQTLFLGGGTPTHLDSRHLHRLLELLAAWLPLSPGHEFSVEANPDTLHADKIHILADFGVNRLSLGAQSFQPHLLGRLERSHRPEEVARAVDRIQQRIRNYSLDLIFGVPGQTVAEWEGDLVQALKLNPVHLSTYGLTYEKGTRLWKQQREGKIQPHSEEAELAMYELAMDCLPALGFEQYEISSFARPGFRCRHNQVYWANHAYLGFGMGAARYVNGRREVNTRDLESYLRKLQNGVSPLFQSEELAPVDRARETAAVQLRRVEGIARSAYREQTGFDLDDLARGVVRKHLALVCLPS